MKMMVRTHAIVYVLERDYLPKVDGITEVFSVVETILDSLVEEVKTKDEWDIFGIINKLEAAFKPHQCEYTNCVLSSIRQGLLGMTGHIEVQHTNTLCPVCREPQFSSLGSICCKNGHIGARQASEEKTEYSLSPCPFCGENSYVALWIDNTNAAFTQNEKLSCQTAQVRCHCGAHGSERYGEDAAEKAVCSWNTRQSSIC